ncbi:response regulator [Thiocystis violacea]|uniref:response regulator n=1 Tax=Thiocystis violacea TaxID=13725 RepID=UPI001905C28B|nr:response regulator [Thiocystis violacea]MBK1724774.1 DNA-binding response regulator [Thiocystis violacea]
MDQTKILLIEDEPDLAEVLLDYLLRDGFDAAVEADGVEGLAHIRRSPPDLLLLDLMLPGLDGLSILREVRKTSDLPVIMVTARVEEIDRLLGLELGADDYVCKPYSPREVVARVKTVLRRLRPRDQGAADAIQAPLVEIDAERWQARFMGLSLALTPKEFLLLQALVSRPGRVFSRANLLDLIAEGNLDVSERAVDSHMKNLRKKLSRVEPEREIVRSVYGVGFVFDG